MLPILRLLTVILLFVGHAAAQLTVDFGRFEVDQGQPYTRDHTAYTNFFAIRPESTNFIHVESYPTAFTLTPGFNALYDWKGGSGSFNTWTNFTRSIVHLAPGSGNFVLNFTNLWPGVYAVRVLGAVTNEWTNAWRAPLIWKAVATTATSTNVYHWIANWITNKVYEDGLLWVQADKVSGPSNHITLTASLDPSAKVNLEVVSLHFEMPIDWSDTNVYKLGPTLYTPEEQNSRTNFAATNTIAGTELSWKQNSPAVTSNTLTAAERTNAFRRWRPLGTMADESYGTTTANFNGTNDYASWFPAPYESNIQNYGIRYLYPWGWTNINTTESFTYDDFIAGRPLTSNTNDFNGYYYSGNGIWNSSWGSYWSFNGYFDRIFPMLINTTDATLAYRYYTFPSQTNVARIGGLILAHLATVYPSYRLEAMDINPNIKNPSAYLNYTDGRWTLRRTGKFAYDGHSGTKQDQLSPVVDWLWPYLASNQKFADDLTEQLPWIEGKTNHVQRLLFNLLRSLAADSTLHASGGDPMLLGLNMQGGPVASNLMNPAVAQISVTPGAGGSWKKSYAGYYSQDGNNLIGSSYYYVVEQPLLSGPDYTRRFKALGGQVGTVDISSSTSYPKLAAFVNTYSSAQVGYGFMASFGDAGDTINSGPGFRRYNDDAFLVGLWRLNPNPRLGKYLYEVLNRSAQTDSEWTQMGIQAAATTRDIRYADSSRILPGLGLIIAEHGLSETQQVRKGAVVIRVGSGYGHDHGDHLDLNIYALGARMGTDFALRNESTLVLYPRATATRVHNVVEVDGYMHEVNVQNGWPQADTEGCNSIATHFSTNGSVQLLGGQLFSGTAKPQLTHQSRLTSLTKIDATNFYVVDLQRVDGGKMHSWSFHGADVGGETNSFSVSETLTNVVSMALSDSAMSYGYFARKHATNYDYGIRHKETNLSSQVWAEWTLGRTATSVNLTNFDGNGGSVVTIAPEQAMYGSGYSAGNPRKVSRVTLFDHTNDAALSAWAFSSFYHVAQPRLYVFNNVVSNYSANATQSTTWLAAHESYQTARTISGMTSIVTDSVLGGAQAPKALAITTSGFTDYHYFSGTNQPVTAGATTWNGQYAFLRRAAGAFTEAKLVGCSAFTNGTFWVVPLSTNTSATISSVNYQTRTLTFAAPLSVRKEGWYRIRNSTHETSYYMTNWTTPTNCQFSGDALIGEMDVSTVSGSLVIASADDGGMVLATYPKRGIGISAKNESGTKSFTVNYDGTLYLTNTGSAVTLSDFSDSDGDGLTSVWLYDFGPGDSVEIPSEVSIVANANGTYTIAANVGFSSSSVGVVNANELTGQDQLRLAYTPTPAVINFGRSSKSISR